MKEDLTDGLPFWKWYFQQNGQAILLTILGFMLIVATIYSIFHDDIVSFFEALGCILVVGGADLFASWREYKNKQKGINQ